MIRYSYIVVPATNVSTFSWTAATTRSNIQILSNTVYLQAVYHAGNICTFLLRVDDFSELNQLHATFWSGGNLSYTTFNDIKYQITAFRPSLLMVSLFFLFSLH